MIFREERKGIRIGLLRISLRLGLPCAEGGISLGHSAKPVKRISSVSRRGLDGTGEEKGILYPRIALNTSGSDVSFLQLSAKSANRPAVLTEVSVGGSESGISRAGTTDDSLLHGEPTRKSVGQELWRFPRLFEVEVVASLTVVL